MFHVVQISKPGLSLKNHVTLWILRGVKENYYDNIKSEGLNGYIIDPWKGQSKLAI